MSLLYSTAVYLNDFTANVTKTPTRINFIHSFRFDILLTFLFDLGNSFHFSLYNFAVFVIWPSVLKRGNHDIVVRYKSQNPVVIACFGVVLMEIMHRRTSTKHERWNFTFPRFKSFDNNKKVENKFLMHTICNNVIHRLHLSAVAFTPLISQSMIIHGFSKSKHNNHTTSRINK